MDGNMSGDVSGRQAIWADPADCLAAQGGEEPLLLFAPAVLAAQVARFRGGFPGLVTYAVKANPEPAVIANLAACGLGGYDVASLAEIEAVRRLAPDAALHFNNPVRSCAEIEGAVAAGVRSFAVDSASELDKLAARLPAGSEISVRFKLAVGGAAYDFGSKFGAGEAGAAALLARVAALGHAPSLTFHPGTQCARPATWQAYVAAAARIAGAAGVRLSRLNVGGGFPARRVGPAPDLEALFDVIAAEARRAFGRDRPALLCEPGRAMVADCMSLAARVRAVRDDGAVFLSDGIYGGLAEWPVLGASDRVETRDPDGAPRRGGLRPRTVFGPTCDSLDRLPGEIPLAADVAEGDWVIFHGMGAYGAATATRFNGFGALRLATVQRLWA